LQNYAVFVISAFESQSIIVCLQLVANIVTMLANSSLDFCFTLVQENHDCCQLKVKSTISQFKAIFSNFQFLIQASHCSSGIFTLNLSFQIIICFEFLSKSIVSG
jgi:hypothetical protein